MVDSSHCARCVHVRHGVAPDPLAGVRLVSKKVLELRAKWQQELETRASFEQERLLAGEPFDFEPYAFPYCHLLSTDEAIDPVTGNQRRLYVLCAAANPNGDCEKFQPQDPACQDPTRQDSV